MYPRTHHPFQHLGLHREVKDGGVVGSVGDEGSGHRGFIKKGYNFWCFIFEINSPRRWIVSL